MLFIKILFLGLCLFNKEALTHKLVDTSSRVNFLHDDTLLITIGGFNAKQKYMSDVDVYSTTSKIHYENATTQAPNTIADFGSTMDISSLGINYIVGGLDGKNYQNNFWKYDVMNNQWSTDLPTFPLNLCCNAVISQAGAVISLGGRTTDGLVADAFAYRDGVWQPLPALPIPDANHCAVVIEKFIYYIATTGDLYRSGDDAQTWSKLSSMVVARTSAGCAAVSDDAILVVGGSNGAVLDSVELYSVSADVWKMVALMANKRWHLAAVALFYGRKESVLACGGGDGSSAKFYSSCEIYDVKKDEWSTAEPMNLARASFGFFALPTERTVTTTQTSSTSTTSTPTTTPASTSTQPSTTTSQPLQHNSLIIVVGGYDGKQATNNVDLYFTTNKSHHAGPPIPDALVSFGGVVTNNTIYILGGTSNGSSDSRSGSKNFRSYSVGTNTGSWTDLWSLPTDISHNNLIAVNGRLYSLGGSNSTSDNIIEVFSYDVFRTMTVWWRMKAPLPSRNKFFDTCTVVIGSSIFYNTYGDLYRSDDVVQTWTRLSTMNVRRASAQCVAVGEAAILVAGGYSDDIVLNAVEIYDIEADTWTRVAPMMKARRDFGMTFLAGSNDILACGGFTGNTLTEDTLTNLCEAYDWKKNKWRRPNYALEIPLAKFGFYSIKSTLAKGVEESFWL